MVMGGFIDIKEDFREMKTSHPGWSFPECLDAYESEKGTKLNNMHVNHALHGFELGEEDLRRQ
jgi:hypothetical protein